ncbi:MAG TPA: nitroreductase, partial [Hellea balneolensis]|nr:nitroreductase [Hellea balneolensis]
MQFTPPQFNDKMKAADPSEEVLRFMSVRRSALARGLAAPGPTEEEKALILRLAARAPDHRKLFPWRFVVFEGEARSKFGDHLARLFKADNPDLPDDRVEFERARFERAPLIVGVVSSPKDCPRGTPVWEQELSA